MKRRTIFKKMMAVMLMVITFASCKKDKDPLIIVPPSSGSQMTLNGLDGSEDNDGTKAANSVFVDFSTDKQYAVARKSWDLGFYCGSDFRVIINNTALAMGKITTKTDMNAVGVADTVGVSLIWNQNNPPVAAGVADAISGDLMKTLIPAIAANDADNKVVLLNRGTGGGIDVEGRAYFMKIKISRNGDGYTLQYAPLDAATFSTVQISKNNSVDFVYVSLDNGSVISGFPEKKHWDIEWTYSSYEIAFGPRIVLYQASDYILTNYLDGIQTAPLVYTDAVTANDAYAKFNKDSADVRASLLSSSRILIGTSWRTVATPGTTTPAGTRKNQFYLVKDADGNFYKLKFLSFAAEDGGTRGKPVIEYALIK